jgi:hypothetical protein
MLKFFSSLNGKDDDYRPLYDNFIASLEKLSLADKHELLILEDCVSADFATEDFNKICNIRTKQARQYLIEGYTIFHSDLDMIFLKDPFPLLLKYLEEYDIIFQRDSKQVCGGFYLAKPSPLTIDFFEYDYQDNIPDQDHFSWRLRPGGNGLGELEANPRPPFDGLKVKILEKDLFPYGRHFYAHSDRLDPYVVHYNWGTRPGLIPKIERMKKYGHWFI